MDTMTQAERRKVRIIARCEAEPEASMRATQRRDAGFFAGVARYKGRWIVYAPKM